MKHNLFNFIFITSLFLPVLLHAEEYKPLVGIPGVSPTNDFNGYINSLYALSISIAALLAVIKIIIAGVKWMMTDIVTSKGDAKKDIQGALIGLMVVLSAVLVLTVINPDLVDVDLTFPQQNESVFSGSTTNKPILDTTKEKSVAITGTTATLTYLDSTDTGQQQLFFQSCKPTTSDSTDPQVRKYTVSGVGIRCIKFEPTELVSVWPGTEELCKKNGNGTGVYMVDPKIKTMGFCVWKKAQVSN